MYSNMTGVFLWRPYWAFLRRNDLFHVYLLDRKKEYSTLILKFSSFLFWRFTDISFKDRQPKKRIISLCCRKFNVKTVRQHSVCVFKLKEVVGCVYETQWARFEFERSLLGTACCLILYFTSLWFMKFSISWTIENTI